MLFFSPQWVQFCVTVKRPSCLLSSTALSSRLDQTEAGGMLNSVACARGTHKSALLLCCVSTPTKDPHVPKSLGSSCLWKSPHHFFLNLPHSLLRQTSISKVPRPVLTAVSVGTTNIISSIILENNLQHKYFNKFTWSVFQFSISIVFQPNIMSFISSLPIKYIINTFTGKAYFNLTSFSNGEIKS